MIGNKIEFEYYNNGEKDLFLCHYKLGEKLLVFTFDKDKEGLEAMSETFKNFTKQTIFSKLENTLKPKNKTNENY